jgi:hypothetical protein
VWAANEGNGLLQLVSAIGQCRFLEYATGAMDDSAFGLHLARQIDPRDVGLYFYAGSAARDLGEALAIFRAIAGSRTRRLTQRLASISVADNARDAEGTAAPFRNRAFGIKGRAHFKDGIQDTDRAVSEVRDGQRHRVVDPAAGIAKRGIGDARFGRQLAAAPCGAGVDNFARDEIGEVISEFRPILGARRLGVRLVGPGDELQNQDIKTDRGP